MQDILLFLQNHWLLTSVLIVIFVLISLLEFTKIRQKTNRLTSLQVTQLINHENAAVIDIRTSDAFTSGHIVGAISLPSSGLNDKIKRIEKFKSQPIVLVCATGTESPKIVSVLAKNGFQQIYILDGGIRAWKMADMPLVKD